MTRNIYNGMGSMFEHIEELKAVQAEGRIGSVQFGVMLLYGLCVPPRIPFLSGRVAQSGQSMRLLTSMPRVQISPRLFR